MASKVKEYGEVLTFFVFETLAFTSFTLGNNLLLYFLFGFLTLAMIIAFNFDHLKELDWMYYLIFLIPFVLFAVLSGFNKFTLFQIDNYQTFSLGTNLLSMMCLLTFVTVGFLSKTITNFKITTGMMVIYGGLSIIVLLGLGYALVKYVPFYTLIYAGKYIYYMGERFPIWDNIPFLMGFSFLDVSIQHFQLFATMLFTSVIGLRYISPKKETRTFIIYCIFALLGFISILFTINKVNLISFTLVTAFILFLLFVPKNGKILKPIFYTILAICSVALIIFFINAQSSWGFASGLQNMIANNAFLNKIFNTNRFSAPVKEMLDGCLATANWFSKPYNPNLAEHFEPSGLFLFDAIIFSGTLGGMGLTIFIGFVIANLIKYYTKSNDSMMAKNLVVGFIGCFFLYSFFCFDATPYSHYTNYIPINHSPMFFITLFLIGYTCMQRDSFKVKLASKTNENSEENVKEETTEINDIKDNEISEINDDETSNDALNVTLKEVEDTNDEKITL